jgi:hypothetical protein
MMCDVYGYSRIDLETYGRRAVTLSGSNILSHTLKYYSPSELPAPDNAPETTHKLCLASCMMCDVYGYSRIDLETFAR